MEVTEGPGSKVRGRWVICCLLSAVTVLPAVTVCEPRPSRDTSGLADAGATLSRALGGPPSPLTKGSSTAVRNPVGHLYHLGAKQFFLDRAKTLAISEEQVTRLRRLWEFDQVERSRYREALANTEREVWRLTGAEEPSLSAIDDSVRAAERLKADRRVSFIRRVGEAAAVLTVHQREMLNMAKATR